MNLSSFVMQMALILGPESVRLYNISTQKWEPEILHTETAGKQWLITPCRTALVAVYHTFGGWVVDAYAMETAGEVQPLFEEILVDEPLPDPMGELPAQVRI